MYEATSILTTPRFGHTHVQGYQVLYYIGYTLQGRTLVVSWLPGNPSLPLKRGGAHRNGGGDALTMPTNASAQYYTVTIRKRLLSSSSKPGASRDKN